MYEVIIAAGLKELLNIKINFILYEFISNLVGLSELILNLLSEPVHKVIYNQNDHDYN